MVDKKIYIIQGEVGTVVGAIKRNSRWNTHTPLVRLLTSVSTASMMFVVGLLVWPDHIGQSLVLSIESEPWNSVQAPG